MTEVASRRGSCGGGPVLPVVSRRLVPPTANLRAFSARGAGSFITAEPFPIDPRCGRSGGHTPRTGTQNGVRFVCGDVRAGAGSEGETHITRRVQRCARPSARGLHAVPYRAFRRASPAPHRHRIRLG